MQAISGIEKIDKVIAIDQTPIGRTPRSNPATYVKIFDAIRDLFSQLPESRAFGYEKGRFSFNVKEGSCPHCSGMGMIKIDMDFMEEEWTLCPFCKGKRFDAKTLSVLYRGKSIHDVLEMSSERSACFFFPYPSHPAKIRRAFRVGLDYFASDNHRRLYLAERRRGSNLPKNLGAPHLTIPLYLWMSQQQGSISTTYKNFSMLCNSWWRWDIAFLSLNTIWTLSNAPTGSLTSAPKGARKGADRLETGTPEAIAKKNTATGMRCKKFCALLLRKKEKLALHKSIPSSLYPHQRSAAKQPEKNRRGNTPRKNHLCTGPSGSGKSSFALETVYAEGQRRYIDSLSFFARQFIKQMPKPKVDEIDGLSAAIAIEQKSHAGSARSTIGTLTEVYDYLRVLYAHLGVAHSPETGQKIQAISKEFVLEKLLMLPQGAKIQILSPLIVPPKEMFESAKEKLQKQGFVRIRLNGAFYELDDEKIPYERGRKNEMFIVVDRLIIKPDIRKRLLDAIDAAAGLSGGTLTTNTENGDLFFNLSFADPTTGKSYPPITPHTFSFNTEQGMCLDCTGLGFQYGADLARFPEILRYTPVGLLRLLWKDYLSSKALSFISDLLEANNVPPHKALRQLSAVQMRFFFDGSPENNQHGLRWIGLNPTFAKLAKVGQAQIRHALSSLLDQNLCPSCKGARLNPLARNVRLGELSISDLCALPIEEALDFIAKITLAKDDHHFLDETLEQLKKRLHFLKLIGLEYLSLDRSAPTLSGGETQRIRLARQLGSGLTGCLYVLDEPTIGLHPHNNALLNDALKRLCALGNTLLLVEHDPLTIELADYVLDFGPEAGKAGGQIVAEGSLQEIIKNPKSLTGAYLSGRKKIPLPAKRRTSQETLQIHNASLHNLKNISVSFPIKAFSCITGVSGSGKSTLLIDIIQPAMTLGLAQNKDTLPYLGAILSGISHFDKLIALNQNPIGHTQRADVASYSDLLSPLRFFYAALPAARAKGLQPKNFSANHKRGMCTTCFGLGTKTIQLQFLPPVKVVCEACRGYRLNPRSLEVHYKEKNLGQALQMTVTEALVFFFRTA